MRGFIMLALLAATPAQAQTLRCTPAESCINDQCEPGSDSNIGFMVIKPHDATSIMRSGDTDIAMNKFADGPEVKWQGVQSLGDSQINITTTLTLDAADMTYILMQTGEFGSGRSTGQCTGLPSGHLY